VALFGVSFADMKCRVAHLLPHNPDIFVERKNQVLPFLEKTAGEALLPPLIFYNSDYG